MFRLKIILLICTLVSVISIPVNSANQKDKKVSLKGRVTDLMGQPIAGATVQLYERSWYNILAQIKFTKTVVTDNHGEYLADNVPYGYYLISIRAKGFSYTEMSRIFLGEDETILDIGVEVGKLTDIGPFEFSGVIKDEAGNPLPDATVGLMSAYNSSIRFQTRTSKEGKYRFVITTEGQFILFASKSGYAVSATAVNGFIITKDLTLKALGK